MADSTTTFKEFLVPNVLETRSPSQTFVGAIEIAATDAGPTGQFRLPGRAALATHSAKGQTTSLPVTAETPVRWVRVTMEGGINIQGDKGFLEFSEIVGYGHQEPVPLAEDFRGRWKGRGVLLALKQEGAIVSGCYDGVGDLQGTAGGNLLKAVGKTRTGNIPSTFVLAIGAKGEIVGVRSTNGAPFRLYAGDAAPGVKTECSGQKAPQLGCGSIVHGITFDFDALSRRRAEAVVAALVARGLDAGRVSAEGRGEKTPIADNASEAGRSLNRRVEVACR